MRTERRRVRVEVESDELDRRIRALAWMRSKQIRGSGQQWKGNRQNDVVAKETEELIV